MNHRPVLSLQYVCSDHKSLLELQGRRKLDMALLGGGEHSHLAIKNFKIPLHATAYLTIPLEPIVAPPQKFITYRL